MVKMENQTENLDYEIERFQASLIPFGYLDIKAAVETAIEGGHDGEWLAEEINRWIENTGMTMENVDPNFVAYDSLLQEARSDIEELTEIDILNDTENQVDVYGNYMCTTLDYSEEAKEELEKILKDIEEDDKTLAIKWLESELG